MQQFSNAARVLEKAYENNPTNTENVGMLVQAYQLSGQMDKAVGVLEKWVEANPGDARAKQMLAAYKLGKEN